MSLTTQFSTIMVMIAGGVYLGCALDTFRRFDSYWKHHRILSYSMEICFWLLQTLVLFYLLFLVNQGEIRLYIFLSVFCGIAAYKSLFASVYQRLLEYIITIIKRCFQITLGIIRLVIIRPIVVVIHLLLAVGLFMVGIAFTSMKILVKFIFFPIRIIGKLIYRLMPENAQKYLVYLAGFYSKMENNITKRWKAIWHKGGSG
ncbi:Spore protein YabQ [Paraliobacillus sp. PM-2]|uniref:spore cortex biosynthesis protein YabQ n=1 Tax=Paraliobacillus sp. PM-2 TaxID=1462524 RepID=UPI00061C10C5|nr:spore cortex biosynthesis protein YabQ [Paraliobacillus sp. PM-2]CQR47471.1 Spore protein YabQ [Paraliobacillus sp. PM-2]